MFGELFQDIKDTMSGFRYGTATRTITVARPYCTPCRGFVVTALQPYGVVIHGYSEQLRTANPLDVIKVNGKMPNTAFDYSRPLPIAQVAKVTVSEAAAVWAEYLLMRHGKLSVVPPYQNAKNQAWAARHGGQMPPQWNKGEPWIEKSCTDGVNAWKEVKRSLTDGIQARRSRT